MDKKNPAKPTSPGSQHPHREPTLAMVRTRARELAVIHGRGAHEASESDYAEARRELERNGPEADPKETLLESLPESARWDPVPGSEGREVPSLPNEDDEDEDGRNASARLAEEGVTDAEDEQAIEAAEDARDRTDSE
jgi:hypothetical protein